jgi:hypothetical protein
VTGARARGRAITPDRHAPDRSGSHPVVIAGDADSASTDLDGSTAVDRAVELISQRSA